MTARAPATGRESSFRKRFWSEEARAGYLFVSPFVIGFLVFTGGPLIASAYLSLTRYDVINPPTFIGLDNYAALLKDNLFYKSLENTLTYVLIHVPSAVLVSLLLAVLLNQRVRGLSFWRAAYYLPMLTPTVAAAVLWFRILSPNNGLLNEALSVIGIQGPGWTIDANWVKPALALMKLWVVGTWMIVFLAALQDVPKELYEAASIDGAGPIRRFRSITLPLISRVTFFVVVMLTIYSLNEFSSVYVMFPPQVFGGQAGPQDSALFYMINLFQQAFTFFRMGYASALAWVLFFITLAITLVQRRIASHVVYTEGGKL
jgi:multiple sugar transport system permease protein